MNQSHLERIEHIAITALFDHNLTPKGWTFAWDRAKRRFGSCNFAKKQITLSKHLAALNTVEACQETILHEIAHAIAGHAAGHGPAWVAACNRVGAHPDRCYQSKDVITPPAKYVRYCPACLQARTMHRKSNKTYACGRCCRLHNKGRFSEKYVLVTIEKAKFDAMKLQ